jgi:hypothetical protein
MKDQDHLGFREIIESVEDFCKVRNHSNALGNTKYYTPRLDFLVILLESAGIPYEVDEFVVGDVPFYNLVMRGTGNRMVIAHHDIVNPNSDNANDNSASVINAIALKKISPETHVVITDGEEVGLIGAKRLAERISSGDFGWIDWVLNIELSGRGGKNFMIGCHEGKLTDHIVSLFNPPIKRTPPSDCYAMIKQGIDTNVINPLPLLTEGESDMMNERGFLDNSSWYLCHSDEDSFDKISIKEMEEFVTEVLLPIVSTKYE